MDYKQKYQEALEKVKGLLKDQEMALHAREKLANVFPELAESEDERIRRGIIRNLQFLMDRSEGFFKEDSQERIDWLESQTFTKKDVDDAYLQGVCDAKHEIEKQGKQKQTWEPNAAQLIVIKDLIEDKSTSKVNKVILRGMLDEFKQFTDTRKMEIEKQGENNQEPVQKPFDYEHATIHQKDFAPKDESKFDVEIPFGAKDSELQEVSYDIPEGFNAEIKDDRVVIKKVEPKFHEGDWIVDDETPYDVFCVIEVLGEIYKVIDADGDDYHIPHCKADKQFHLWTISDAEDGDVLYSIDSKQPFIYKERTQFSQAIGYCCINKFGEFAIWDTHKCVICTDKYIPATKEQRDLLFQKMADAGYEWDAENKKLKTIEQKPVDNVEPKFKVGNYIVPDNITSLEIWKVINIDEDGYYNIQPITNIINTEDNEIYRVPGFILEKDYRLWSINDAKYGDVLAINWHEDDDSLEKIIIFKKYHNKGVKGLYSMPCVEGYGNTFKNGKLAFQEEIPYYSETWTANLHPATKEQRELLFQKMKEAGYEWDGDKKELKRIEQKSTDNVEPKFKVGVWFVNNNRKDTFLIKNINTKGYCTLEDIKGSIISPCLPPCESDSHLWTIADAKDGDVLVDEYNNIGLYSGEKDDLFWHSCIYLGCDDYLRGSMGCHGHKNTKPATKEQRDLLFAKMHDAGYTWDSEKKELRKTEHKMLDADKVMNC